MSRLLPLLVAACLCWALGCWEVLWFVPVALFMPPALLTPAVACGTACSSTPASVSVTFSGIANVGCSSCTSYDGTYVLSAMSQVVNDCVTNTTFSGACFPAFTSGVDVTIRTSGADALLVVTLTMPESAGPGVTSIEFRATLGTAMFDCKNAGTVSVPWFQEFASSSLACTGVSATCSVTLG